MANAMKQGTGAGSEQVVQRMGEAAVQFLAALTPEQRAQAVIDFDQEEKRTFWHYVPTDILAVPRGGLALAEMDRRQQRLAEQLVATGLSRAGYVTAATIMGLEMTLDLFEGWSRSLPGRDSRLFYVRIFGTPNSREPWGWSFEGHHISLNYTIVENRIVAPTPTFFGANPAEAPLGGGAMTLRPLQGVEDLARELVHALDAEQRAATVVAAKAPPDIVTTNRPYLVDGLLLADEEAVQKWQSTHGVTEDELAALRYQAGRAPGIGYGELHSGQQEILLALIGEYIHRMPDELAKLEIQKLQVHGLEHTRFAWAGGIERRQPHYYRIQDSLFMVEYDNTQNDANHIHSVWRDPCNDYGADILAHHYAHHH
jgi:hypothetical protein